MAKILVVDDDPDTLQLFKSLLTPFGHQVMEAGDGREGLTHAQAEVPDIIISDILMPTMNGYEFVSSLRKVPALEKIPVIFHSASFLSREARSLGAACGVSLFLTKPCEPETTLEIVHQALGLEVRRAVPQEATEEAKDAIPGLIDAYFQKGKELDAVSIRLASLLDLGLDLARPCRVTALLEKAGSAARQIIGANYAAIGILGEDRIHLRAFAALGMDPEIVAKLGQPVLGGPIFNALFWERKAQRVFRPVGESGSLGLPASHPPVHSLLAVPMEIGGRMYGWIYVAEKLASLAFTDEDERILRMLAAQTALAFENSERFQTIQERTAHLELEVVERKRAEDRFRRLVEAAPTGIVIVDESGRITEVNAQATQMFGYAREELIGETVEILMPQHLQKAHEGHRASYSKDPYVRPMGIGMELLARRKDGTEFPVEISLGPLATKEGMLISSTIMDITARKKMEQQLRLSQRMEAIGMLAGGVAHDFNNLLGVILGSADMALDTLPPGHPAAGKVEMIRKAGASAADLTRQLLAFSRQQMLQPRVLDLKEIVDRTQSLLGRLIGENIEVAISLDPSLGCVKADPGQLEQVILNLAVNARDAMPQGGRLTIAASNVELDDSYKESHEPVVPGRYVMLAMEDTGCGMDRKTQSRIFDPFFTTKERGKGTGLGLATVYGIVKQSGGYIWVYSELNQGTVFKVYLPRVEQTADRIAQKEPDAPILGGCETILLVEDSESLRDMAREYLESAGYRVLAVSSGKEAVQWARDFDGPIHLLFTDVVMPEMSGPELAAHVRSHRPETKIIFTSGYTDDAIARQGVLEPGAAFVQKPYRPKALARKIREVLGPPAAIGGSGDQAHSHTSPLIA